MCCLERPRFSSSMVLQPENLYVLDCSSTSGLDSVNRVHWRDYIVGHRNPKITLSKGLWKLCTYNICGTIDVFRSRLARLFAIISGYTMVTHLALDYRPAQVLPGKLCVPSTGRPKFSSLWISIILETSDISSEIVVNRSWRTKASDVAHYILNITEIATVCNYMPVLSCIREFLWSTLCARIMFTDICLHVYQCDSRESIYLLFCHSFCQTPGKWGCFSVL